MGKDLLSGSDKVLLMVLVDHINKWVDLTFLRINTYCQKKEESNVLGKRISYSVPIWGYPNSPNPYCYLSGTTLLALNGQDVGSEFLS